MAKPRRKKRTAIRTAAGTVQELYVARMKALRENPLAVLPEMVGDEPKPLQKIRNRIEKMGESPGFFDRRDKGIVGAVAHAKPLAELESVPRIADHKVAGKRRFYLQRGHVTRGCSLGVQNFDDPVALLMAYRDMAKSDGLHFFAGSKLWCTGSQPNPPAQWLSELTGCDLSESDGRYACSHNDVDRVMLQWRGGPELAICPPCARQEGALHGRITQRYAGPKQRQPVDIQRLAADGNIKPLEAEIVAAYRGGLLTESLLLKRG